jgi:hypothetical protein
MLRHLAASSLVLAVLLAGCANGGKDADAVNIGGRTVDLADTTNSATQGSISGVVVDDAIRPLAGVAITIANLDRNATTIEDGLFAFEGLDPGLYTLAVVPPAGYLPVQTTAEVVAGQTSKVRVVTPIDSSPQPRHVTLAFDWYDSAGVALVDFAIDLFDGSLLNDSLPPACEKCTFEFITDEAPASLIYEATWEITVANPAGDGDWYWTIDDLIGGDYESDYCAKPCLVDIPLGSIGNSTQYSLTVSSDEDWVVYNQRAQLFMTVFYVAAAPDGWSFIAGDK